MPDAPLLLLSTEAVGTIVSPGADADACCSGDVGIREEAAADSTAGEVERAACGDSTDAAGTGMREGVLLRCNDA